MTSAVAVAGRPTRALSPSRGKRAQERCRETTESERETDSEYIYTYLFATATVTRHYGYYIPWSAAAAVAVDSLLTGAQPPRRPRARWPRRSARYRCLHASATPPRPVVAYPSALLGSPLVPSHTRSQGRVCACVTVWSASNQPPPRRRSI